MLPSFLKTNIKPRSSLIKRNVVLAGFFALGRAVESTSGFEADVMKEVETWPDGFSFSMNVVPKGPNLVMEKRKGRMKLLGFKKKDDADLIVEVKNLDTAFKMITTQLGAHDVYAQHKIGVIGNVADSMKLIRIIYIAEGYLFPEILNKNILKKSPEMDLQKQINRLRIYTVGLLFGK